MKKCIYLLFTCLSSGCATIPPAVIEYHYPKAELSVKVTQSVMCIKKSNSGNPPNWQVITASSAEITPQYVADKDETGTVTLSDFGSDFADATAEVKMTSDGRLKSINADSTGQGQELIVTALNVVSSFAGIRTGFLQMNARQDHPCDYLSKLNDQNPVTFSATQIITNLENNKSVIIQGVGGNYPNIQPLLPNITIKMIRENQLPDRISCENCSDKTKTIKIPKQEYYKAIAYVATPSIDGEYNGVKSELYFTSLLVPNAKETQEIPIYSPSAFGKVELSLNLGEAGEITKIKYGASGSAKGASASISAISDLLKDNEYEELKADTDLMYEQQRRIRCEANPSPENCA